MKIQNAFIASTISLSITFHVLPGIANAEEWHRIPSVDGRASVMFPIPLDENKVRTTVDKTPAGKATTRMLEYQDEGMLFTISGTELPGLAVQLAGETTIMKKSKEGLLSKAYSKEASYVQYDGLKGPKAMLLKYDSANLQKEGHPGFKGFAVLFLLGNKLYMVNSMLENGTDETTQDENLAAQEKLLKSIEIHY
jgi:hypothetical protein